MANEIAASTQMGAEDLVKQAYKTHFYGEQFFTFLLAPPPKKKKKKLKE